MLYRWLHGRIRGDSSRLLDRRRDCRHWSWSRHPDDSVVDPAAWLATGGVRGNCPCFLGGDQSAGDFSLRPSRARGQEGTWLLAGGRHSRRDRRGTPAGSNAKRQANGGGSGAGRIDRHSLCCVDPAQTDCAGGESGAVTPGILAGADLAIGLAVSTIGGALHLASGNCLPPTLAKLLLGGLAGVPLGVGVANRVAAPRLRLAVLLCATLLGAWFTQRGLAQLIARG